MRFRELIDPKFNLIRIVDLRGSQIRNPTTDLATEMAKVPANSVLLVYIRRNEEMHHLWEFTTDGDMTEQKKVYEMCCGWRNFTLWTIPATGSNTIFELPSQR
jgi:hypothetical protein